MELRFSLQYEGVMLMRWQEERNVWWMRWEEEWVTGGETRAIASRSPLADSSI